MWDSSCSMWYSQLTLLSFSCKAHQPLTNLPSHSYQIEHGIVLLYAPVRPLRAMRGCCRLEVADPCLHITLIFACMVLVVVVRFICALLVVEFLVLTLWIFEALVE